MADTLKIRLDQPEIKLEAGAQKALTDRIESANHLKVTTEKNEAQAQAVVSREVQKVISNIANLRSRVMSRLMFKDQSRLIDQAAAKVADIDGKWFKARKEQIGDEFKGKIAKAKAMEEVRAEMEKQIAAMQEKQAAAKDALRLMRENAKWWQIGKKTGLVYEQYFARRAEKRAEKADRIFQKHTEKMDTRLENIKEIRAKFCEASGIDDATLTKLVAGESISFQGANYKKLSEFIASQPVELKDRLRLMAKEIVNRQGLQHNNKLRADQVFGDLESRKAINEQLRTAGVGQRVELETKNGKMEYEVVNKKENGMLTLVVTDEKKLAPVLAWGEKKGFFVNNFEANVLSWKAHSAKKDVKKAEAKLGKQETSMKGDLDQIARYKMDIKRLQNEKRSAENQLSVLPHEKNGDFKDPQTAAMLKDKINFAEDQKEQIEENLRKIQEKTSPQDTKLQKHKQQVIDAKNIEDAANEALYDNVKQFKPLKKAA